MDPWIKSTEVKRRCIVVLVASGACIALVWVGSSLAISELVAHADHGGPTTPIRS